MDFTCVAAGYYTIEKAKSFSFNRMRAILGVMIVFSMIGIACCGWNIVAFVTT